MNLPCRILAHDSADGPANMALDEALLDTVSDNPARAVFRTYEWSIPTLSLGYFQKAREAEADPRWRDVAMVRRLTGGGAIWHHHELTYALVVPERHPLAGRGTALYHAVHEAISEMFRTAGVSVGRWGDRVNESPADRPFLCFEDRNPEDLVAGSAKVVGSAQRRRFGAVLQHGSILLAHSPRTPELLGICDVIPVAADTARWASDVCAYVLCALGLRPQPGELTMVEKCQTRALRERVYGERAWNFSR
jgi:lipoate-protein ligase A